MSFIINSLLQSDMYKFSMGQLAFHFRPEKKKIAEYSMKCRSGQNLIPLKGDIEKEIAHWLNLKLSEEELNYLARIEVNGSRVFKDDYLDFLKEMNLAKELDVKVVVEKGHLNIRVKGDWKYSIFAEVPFLAIVQELYWKKNLSEEEYYQAEQVFEARLQDKVKYLKTTNIKFAEFGTRRRFSEKLQRRAIEVFKAEASDHMIATSNLYFAKEFNLIPSGTQAHEFYQGFQGLTSIPESQPMALTEWVKEYPDKLKIALTDIFGTDLFLQDFNKELAQAYDGVRQDSGVPREFALKMKAHYEALGIDSKTKTLLFSDDLNFEKADALEKEFGKDFKVLFGIGTYCTNDTGLKPVSLVMKMVRMNGKGVIKISDSPGKVMCEDESVIKETQSWIQRRVGHKVLV